MRFFCKAIGAALIAGLVVVSGCSPPGGRMQAGSLSPMQGMEPPGGGGAGGGGGGGGSGY